MPPKKPRHPNSLKNLKSFKKGVCSNPKGRGKGVRNRSTILREMLALKMIDGEGKLIKNPFTKKGTITLEEGVDAALIQRALKGNIDAIREIKDTLHGKIKDVQEIIQPDVTEKEIEEMSDEEAAKLYDAALKS